MAKRNSAYRLQQEKVVIDIIIDNPTTIAGIAEQTGLQYYTVRRVIDDLLSRGIVKVVGHQEKARLFLYNLENEERHDFIPRLTDVVAKNNVKAIYILEAVGKEMEMQATQAVMRMPRHIANLMIAANFASHGQDVNFRLDRIRAAMQKDMLFIKNNLSLYEQILSEPRFWDPNYIADMTKDQDYNYLEVQKAVDYYEQEAP